MKFAPFVALLAFLITATLNAQIKTGPMIAHLEMREAKIWLQTDEPALIRVNYKTAGSQAEHWSLPVETNASKGNTAVAILDKVEPGQKYSYTVEVNGKTVPDSYTFTSPKFYLDREPPPNFTIAAIGSHFQTDPNFDPPYQTLGGNYEIFDQVLKTQPELVVWVGDTANLRSADLYSKSGYIKRFATARSTPELRKLLATVPHYATWGASDSGSGKSSRQSTSRKLAREAFQAFWPMSDQVEQFKGVASQFRYADVDFFLLDARSLRNENPDSTSTREFLGKAQIEWLRAALVESDATFKVVVSGSPIMNPAETPGNLSTSDVEHDRMLDMFRNERISGLLFLSGGKPYGELTRFVQANSYDLHDLTVGPVTGNTSDKQNELNYFRMPGTSVFDRHFATLTFEGPEDDRRVTLRVIDSLGNERWNRPLQASDLAPIE